MPMMPKSFDEVIAKLILQGSTINVPQLDWSMPCPRPESTTSMDFSDPQKPDWPTPKDIEECCWKYKHEDSDDTYTIYPSSLSNWKSREHFDSEIVKMCGKKVPGESIPPQCVPGYEEPTPAPDWKADAVRRYPRVTEWD